MYAAAWESDFGKLILHKDQDEPNPPNPYEVTVQCDQTNAETCSTPPTRDISPDFFPQTKGLCVRSDTDQYIEPDAELCSEESNSNRTNARSTKIDLCFNPKTNCNGDYR